jgi:hypothetical protein
MTAIPIMTALRRAEPPLRPPAGVEGPLGRLARMAEAAGVPLSRLAWDIAGLALGLGRVGLADYEDLRLYDPALWHGADRREVVGAGRARRIARQANFRRDCLALANDRLASSAYLAAHGLPTAPILAIYRAGLAAPGAELLRSRDELRLFLEGHVGQPLVVQPAQGAGARVLFDHSGRDPASEIDALLAQAADAPGVSWLIQPRLGFRDGGGLTTVRVLTLAGERGAKVFRALWRLGGRDDLVASLDLRTGAALTLASARAPHRAQPAPPDLVVPGWTALKATATESARLFAQFGLLGWDIAPGEAGPTILGVDPAPDLAAHQLADRRGALEPEFRVFLAERRRLAGEWRKTALRGL